MPVYIIDTLKPKNGLDFPIVEAVDVAVEGYDSLADAVTHFATDTAIATITAALEGKADTSDITALQAQINQIEISASAEAVVAPEVAAARVGEDGTEYSTLKARLDAENSQLKSDVSDLTERIGHIPVTITESMFEKGSINASGQDSTFHQNSRCRNKNAIKTAYDVTVTVSGAYYSIIYYTDDGEYDETIGFTNTSSVIPANRFFRLILTLDPNSDTLASVHDIYSHFTFSYDDDVAEDVEKLKADVIVLDRRISEVPLTISEVMFEKGNINSSGQNTTFHENSRCRTKNFLKSPYDTIISVSGAYHSIMYYDDNGDFDEAIAFSGLTATVDKNRNFRLLLTLDVNHDDLASISDICSHFSFSSQGVRSIDAETAAAKTNADNITYTTLKERLDTENADIKNELSELNKRIDSVPSTIQEDMFEKGSINANGQNSTFHEASRCRMKNTVRLAYDTTVNSDGAYHSLIYYDDNGDFEEAVPFTNLASVIPKDKLFRIILTINPNRDDLATVDEIYSHFSFVYSSNDVPDEEAVDLILAANRHFDTEHTGTWDRYDFTGLPTFTHLTDIHEDSKRFELFKRFSQNSYVTQAICTGDIVNTATVANVFDYIGDSYNEILFAVGNHDREGITKSEVKSYLMPNQDNTYYYADFDNIRLIVLDQLDQADSGTSGGIGQYTQTQIDWLIALLKNSYDYHVLIAMHAPEKTPVKNTWGFYQRHYQWTMGENEYIAYAGGTIIEDIIDAFKHGKALSKEYRTVTVDTTFTGQGNFIAYMCGHYHADMIGYAQDHSDQIYLLCDQGRCTSNSASDLARYEGFKSQNCFNAYVIDTQERKIKIIRIGADHNDILEKRKILVLEYD